MFACFCCKRTHIQNSEPQREWIRPTLQQNPHKYLRIILFCTAARWWQHRVGIVQGDPSVGVSKSSTNNMFGFQHPTCYFHGVSWCSKSLRKVVRCQTLTHPPNNRKMPQLDPLSGSDRAGRKTKRWGWLPIFRHSNDGSSLGGKGSKEAKSNLTYTRIRGTAIVRLKCQVPKIGKRNPQLRDSGFFANALTSLCFLSFASERFLTANADSRWGRASPEIASLPCPSSA